MISIDTMHEHNHKIAEHSKVLSVLIRNRELCDTQVMCDIFFSYVDAVKEHLTNEEKISISLCSFMMILQSKIQRRILCQAQWKLNVFSLNTQRNGAQKTHCVLKTINNLLMILKRSLSLSGIA